MAKWRRRPEERPRQILGAALDAFSSKGFARATMDEIAEAAGITKGTIYLYFRSKKDLLLAVIRAELEDFMGLLPSLAGAAPGDLEAHARQLGRTFLDALMAPAAAKTVQVILSEMRHLPELKRLYLEEALPRANAQMAEFLSAQMDRGTLRTLDPSIATRCLFGMFFIFVLTQELFGASRVTPMAPEQVADTVLDIFLHGILTKGPVS
ncbi:MAG: TetR/AcrR family transcriptional regulator [Candidatus Hydrogenedentales bacterium]